MIVFYLHHETTNFCCSFGMPDLDQERYDDLACSDDFGNLAASNEEDGVR